eukprot:CAMPEP_0168366480 /NCGR_PEP_ID=MMETSP0228-20121227/5246_1 /TAXON_ID=133427 /ORGANISM="Protoceratium reticulatum, Strain CCCM 535 (=CCMP 1889)" /LENGTH=549 /DNA_ID=CAMNT_0008379275 /DNA_START=9 /DNA_END=1655 /DNA_ORIENTATION=+
MELIRRRCAARLQRKLQDPRLRMEKAALGTSTSGTALPAASSHEGDAAAGAAAATTPVGAPSLSRSCSVHHPRPATPPPTCKSAASTHDGGWPSFVALQPHGHAGQPKVSAAQQRSKSVPQIRGLQALAGAHAAPAPRSASTARSRVGSNENTPRCATAIARAASARREAPSTPTNSQRPHVPRVIAAAAAGARAAAASTGTCVSSHPRPSHAQQRLAMASGGAPRGGVVTPRRQASRMAAGRPLNGSAAAVKALGSRYVYPAIPPRSAMGAPPHPSVSSPRKRSGPIRVQGRMCEAHGSGTDREALFSTPSEPSRGCVSPVAAEEAELVRSAGSALARSMYLIQGLHDHDAMSTDSESPSRRPVEHFSIADPVSPELAPTHARQLKDVAHSLETAASAIRQAIGRPVSSAAIAEQAGLRAQAAAPTRPASIEEHVSPRAVENGLGYGDKQPLWPQKVAQAGPRPSSVTQLSQENDVLRGALGDAVRRLSEIEGEQERFMSEGVFDLVNSLCRETATATDAAVLEAVLAEGIATEAGVAEVVLAEGMAA